MKVQVFKCAAPLKWIFVLNYHIMDCEQQLVLNNYCARPDFADQYSSNLGIIPIK